MKISKYITITLSLVFTLMLSTSFAQNEGVKMDGKWATIEIKVEGICGMCETRIENALDLKGVKFADWDLDTKVCKIIYRPDKISEEEFHKTLTAIGHDTESMKATDEAYGGIHSCCKYRSDTTH